MDFEGDFFTPMHRGDYFTYACENKKSMGEFLHLLRYHHEVFMFHKDGKIGLLLLAHYCHDENCEHCEFKDIRLEDRDNKFYQEVVFKDITWYDDFDDMFAFFINKEYEKDLQCETILKWLDYSYDANIKSLQKSRKQVEMAQLRSVGE